MQADEFRTIRTHPKIKNKFTTKTKKLPDARRGRGLGKSQRVPPRLNISFLYFIANVCPPDVVMTRMIQDRNLLPLV